MPAVRSAALDCHGFCVMIELVDLKRNTFRVCVGCAAGKSGDAAKSPGPGEAAPEKTPAAPKRLVRRRSPPPRKAAPEATTPAAGAAIADKEKSTARRRGDPTPRGNAPTVPPACANTRKRFDRPFGRGGYARADRRAVRFDSASAFAKRAAARRNPPSDTARFFFIPAHPFRAGA